MGGAKTLRLRDLAGILREAVRDLFDDQAMRLAASISYYAILSLAPLLLLLLTLLGLFWDQQVAGQEITGQVRSLVGESGAEVAQTVFEHAEQMPRSWGRVLIGLALLVAGASGVFAELQGAMNVIWEVKARPRKGLWGFLRKRLFSVGMLLATAFLLMVSLAISAGLAAVGSRLQEGWPDLAWLWGALNVLVPFIVFTGLFVLLFKYIPDVVISWWDVWTGAILTAILFSVGKLLIGLYLGHSSVAKSYGVAGSVIALLIWVYYSSIIVLLGAEVTQVVARARGSAIQPSEHAEPATGPEPAQAHD